jgi:hypothetical protein
MEDYMDTEGLTVVEVPIERVIPYARNPLSLSALTGFGGSLTRSGAGALCIARSFGCMQQVGLSRRDATATQNGRACVTNQPDDTGKARFTRVFLMIM